MSLEFIHVDDLLITERQRKDFKEKPLQDLADSIKRVGLIHAPVVTSDWKLVAGERRIRALAMIDGTYSYSTADDLEYPEIPVNVISSDDPQLIFEIELEENLRRVNLTPMEEAQAIAELHQVRVANRPEQTMKDTATEIAEKRSEPLKKSDERQVANAILVDQFRDDPEVQQAAKVSLTKAAKVARKKMEIEIVQALDRMEGITEDDLMNVIQGSAEHVMRTFNPDSFDILLFDPPYGVGADKFGDAAMDLGHQYTDDWDTALSLVDRILTEKQVLKPNAHVLMFCAYEKFDLWRELYEAHQFNVWPRPLIWSKGQQAHAPVPGRGPRYSYECILFATKGERLITKTVNDVFHFPPPRDKIHAAEKPAELLASLIDFVASPGDRILDPTCGSGSIFLGAKGKEVHVTGIEIDEGYAAIARERTR